MARPATAMGKWGSPRSFNLASISACMQRPKASKRDSDARHRRRYYPGATAAIAPRGFFTGLSAGAPFARLIGLILASSCTAHGTAALCRRPILAGRYVGRQAPVAHTVRSHNTQREPKQSDAGKPQSAHGCAARPPAKRSCMDYRGRSAGAVTLNGSLIA